MDAEVVKIVAGKVADLLVSLAKRNIDYVRNYTENVEKLRNEIQNLNKMIGTIQQQIQIGQDKGDILLHGVQDWVVKANAEIIRAEEFLRQEDNAKKRCFNLRVCANLRTLYHYSKTATNKITPSLLQCQKDGKTYESCVYVPAPTPGPLQMYIKKNLIDIDTQKLVLEDIIEAIKDESIQTIGIYGPGGVGKTTLVMEVATKMKKLFSHIAIIDVSQNVDVENIKKNVEIASKKVMNGDTVLIILDDVWNELELSKVGIPCGTHDSIKIKLKILLTSRSMDVCVAMNAQRKILVNTLKTEESWILFKRVVGEEVTMDAKLKQVARDVAEGCGGLPLILQAVGKTLKNKSIQFWKDALDELQNQAVVNISAGIKNAFIHLKLSYDYLENKEAKWCFLLCSMFPEDVYIPCECLVQYGVGLGKFNNLDSIEVARRKVRIAVETLKSSFLLLNGNTEFTIKMHDIVREVALLIVNDKKKEFLVKAGKDLIEWKPRKDTLGSYRGISLMKNEICRLPDFEFCLPHLDILLLQENNELSMISDDFIRGIKNTQVLDMENNNISVLPQSFELLTNLCMLNFGGNTSVNEISILGELIHLEILILHGTGIKEIPEKIGQLCNLRRLDLKRCKKLSHIAPGVISKLQRLEELCIGYYSVQEGNYNCLVELGCLSMLTFLDLFLPNYDLIPEGVHFEKFNFVIQIGGHENVSYFPLKLPSNCHLILENIAHTTPFLIQIMKLIKVSRNIHLKKIPNLNNLLPTLNYKSFDCLESIKLFDCDDVTFLIDTTDWDEKNKFHSSKDLGERNTSKLFFSKIEHLTLSRLAKLKDIWNCPDQYISFSSLVTLEIDGCPKLVRIFSISVSQELVNLKKLSITNCECLEEVVWARDEETSRGEIELVVQDATVVFQSLVEIFLSSLPKLKYFCSNNSTYKYPSLIKVNISNCPNMRSWGCKVHHTPKLEAVNHVRLYGHLDINNAVLHATAAPVPYQVTYLFNEYYTSNQDGRDCHFSEGNVSACIIQ